MKGEIQINQLRFAYPASPMYFDMRIEAGSFTIVTGPSGSGKSTLLNLIAGFETPLSGSVVINGEPMIGIAPARRPVAFLFQDHNLFAHLSVEANVGLGIAPDLKLSAAQQGLVREALARVGLEDKAARKPGALSGGERQRAAFARILVQSRPILLLDEPFASLGPSLRKEMMQLLSALAKEKQLTILAVTHHPDEWYAIADQFVFIENGNVSATGPIEALNASFEKAALRAYFDNESIFKLDGTSRD